MNKSFRILGLVAIGLSSLIGSAMAVPTAIELGSVSPGSPADPSAETARLVTLVSGYNSGLTGVLSDAFTGDSGHTYTLDPAAGVPAAPSLPTVGTNIGQNSGGGGVQTGLQVDLGLGGYSYIMVKWGNSSEYYYIGGFTGTIIVNNDVNGNGESHFDLFTGSSTPSVPDASSTVAMLGLVTLGLVAVSRMVRPVSV